MSLYVKNGGTWAARTPYVKNGGVWKPVSQALAKIGGVWTTTFTAEIVATLSSTSASVDIRSLFTTAAWASATPKRVLIPAGVSIGSNNWYGALYLLSGAAWGGVLTIENHGALYGIGGVPWAYSGEGGRAIGATISGDTGQRIIVENYGTVYAGGGAGGMGGTGGSGQYQYVAGDTGWQFSLNTTTWQQDTGSNQAWVKWDGITLAQDPSGSLISQGYWWSSGTVQYLRGSAAYGTTQYYIRRLDYATAYTSGGSGGTGGRGQGSDGNATAGAGGGSPGTNAGWGGQGGTGGNWGATGGSGASGGNGNNGGGSGGAGGGAAGAYSAGYVTFNNHGTVAGRVV